MLKLIIKIIIIFGLFLFFYLDYFYFKLEGNWNYYMSFMFVLVGFLLCLKRNKNIQKIYILIFPIIVLLLFDTFNILVVKYFYFRLVFINYLFFSSLIFYCFCDMKKILKKSP